MARPGRERGWKLTAEGSAWLTLVGLLLTVSIAKNINLLALLACLLAAVLLLSLATTGRGLRRLEIRRSADDQLVAGMVGRVTLRITLHAGGPLRGVAIEDSGTDHQRAWYLDAIEPGTEQTLVADFVPSLRGWYDLAPLTVSTRYPFGLVSRRRQFGGPSRVLVLPRPGRLSRDRLRQFLRGADARGDRTLRRGRRHETAQADFHGLRPFRPGDSPRWIHWRSSARRGELLVREFEDVPSDDLLLVVDGACPPGGDFEAVVSLAAAVVHAWCVDRGDRLVAVVPGAAGLPDAVLDGMTGPDHARCVLERLAVAAPGGKANGAAAGAAAGLGALVGGLVVSWGSSSLAGEVESAWGRPVVHLDVARQYEWEFYTPP